MKIFANGDRKTPPGIKAFLGKLATAAAVLLAARGAFAQSTLSWTGTAGDFKLATANNWSTLAAPNGGASDLLQWDITAATGNLIVTNANALDASPGLNLNVTSDHTGSLTIVGTQRLRLNTNSLTIASGAGAFTFGYGASTAFPLVTAGAGNGAVHAWTNNSAFTATINSEIYFLMGGGGGHTLALGGTGNWNVYAQLQAQNSGAGLALTVNGPGNVFYAPTNAPGTTFAGVFNGITVNAGTLKFGNGGAVPATITINGGKLDINGFSLTNTLSGNGVMDTTLVGGTPTLTISNNNNTVLNGSINNSQGVLTLVKRGAGTFTMNGTNTYSGTTTIGTGTILVNGKLGAGDVTVSNTAGFGGSGTIGGNVTWQTGATTTFGVTNNGSGNGTVFTVAGIATVDNNSVTVNVAGPTPLPVGTYTLMSASSIVGTLPSIPTYSGAGVASGSGSSLAISGGTVTLSVTNLGTNSVWISDLAGGTGNWTTAASWLNNVVPQNPGDVATLGVSSALSTINLDANLSLGGLNLTNANSFVIGNAGKTLTFDDIGTGVLIAVNNGNTNAIATAVSLNDKVTVSVVGPTNKLTISGAISGTGPTNTLSSIGNGTLVLSGNNTYGPAVGSVGTILSGGTLELGSAQALGAGDLTNTANTTLRLDVPMTLPNKLGLNTGTTLNLDDTGKTVTLSGGLAGSGSITKIGVGKDVLSTVGTSTFGTLNLLTNGTVEIASGTFAANGQLFVDSSSTLQIDAGASLNYLASGFGYVGNTPGLTATNIINGSLNYSNANFVVGRFGPGVMIINSGGFSCNNFFDGQDTNAEPALVFLNGGTLLVTNVQSTGNAANILYFRGGAVAAKGPNTSFWVPSGQLTVYVGSTPGIISNGGFNITIGQAFASESGSDAGMIFNGSGVTTVTASENYTGPTVVKGGTLFNNGVGGTGDVIVQSGAAYGGIGTAVGAVTYQTGSSVSLVLTNSGGNNTSPFNIYGLTTANNNTVVVNVPGSSPLPVGRYTLMYCNSGVSGTFAPTATFTGAGIAGGTVGTITVDGIFVYLTVAVGGNSWSHDGSGNWSTASDWSGNPIVPGAPGDSAVLGVGSAFTTVSLDTNISLAAISFTNFNSFAIANTGKTLTMTNNAGNVAINVFAGTTNSIAAPVILNGAVAVTASGASALQVPANISGPGSVSLGGDGTGVMTLAGSNTYSGGTTVNAGALVLGNTNAIGTGVLRMNGGALDSAVTNLVMRGNSSQQWFGNFSFLGSNNLSTGTGAINVSNALTVSVTNKLVIPGVINAGALALTFVGNGTLELDSSNTIGTLNSGVSVLYFGTNSAAGTGVLNAYSTNAAFASSSTNSRTIHNVVGAGNGALGWIYVGSGDLTFDGGVTSYNFSKLVSVSNAVTTWNFALPAGLGGTTKLGPGTLVLNGANANTGGNVVQEGTLALANGGALGIGGPLVMNGGNLDAVTANLTNININAQTWNTNFTFRGSQNLNLGSGAVTLATNGMVVTVTANTLAIGGAISDGGLVYPLTIAGAGTLALAGNNSYSGDTTIASGTLRIDSPGALNNGAYAGAITNNGTFNYASSTPQTLSGVISGTGSLIKSGTGLLTLSGANSYTGNTTITTGTLELSTAVLYTNSTVSISNGATIQLDFGGINKVKSLVLNGVYQPVGIYGSSTPGGFISGSGSLQVLFAGPTGPGTLTNSVSGSNLSLAWPAGQGWRLQMQTNGLTSTNWIYLTDGSIVNTNIPIDKTLPSVFYRLVYP